VVKCDVLKLNLELLHPQPSHTWAGSREREKCYWSTYSYQF